MEVRNRFRGFLMIDRVPDELWTEFRDIVHCASVLLLRCSARGGALALSQHGQRPTEEEWKMEGCQSWVGGRGDCGRSG